MTKATEIKLEDDREDLERGLRDRRRGLKIVPATKNASTSKGRLFNIGVADNIFSPRVSVLNRSGLSSSNKRRSQIETSHVGSVTQVPDTLRTIGTVGIFVVAVALGFLIGRRRD